MSSDLHVKQLMATAEYLVIIMLYVYTTDITCLLGTMITFTPTHVYTHIVYHIT